jgi:hypothetical protein
METYGQTTSTLAGCQSSTVLDVSVDWLFVEDVGIELDSCAFVECGASNNENDNVRIIRL